MEVQAKAKWVRTSPRKVRLVAQSLRNLPVSEALTACQFMPKAAARDVAKVIRSAQANAENNFNLVRDELVVKDIRVEPGPMLKRGQPRAMGRLFSVFKRTSHITAVVEDRPGAVRRRTATLPRAPQPGAPARETSRPAARQAPAPAAAAAARAAAEADAATEAATTESDEREEAKPRRARNQAKTETKTDSKKQESTSTARGKKSEAKAEPKKAEAKKKEDKKDSKEKKSK
jgi:large subunit ribosomal protein L22